MYVFSLHVCLCTICVSGTRGEQKKVTSPRTWVTDEYESPCGCWQLNLCPLEESSSVLNRWTITLAPPFISYKSIAGFNRPTLISLFSLFFLFFYFLLLSSPSLFSNQNLKPDHIQVFVLNQCHFFVIAVFFHQRLTQTLTGENHKVRLLYSWRDCVQLVCLSWKFKYNWVED